MTRLMPHFPLLRPDARFWKCWVMGARTVTWTSPDLTSLARRSGGRGPGLAMEPGPTFAHLPCPRCLRQSLYRATPASLNRWDSHVMMSILKLWTLSGDWQTVEQSSARLSVCEGKDTDGVWEGGQGGHVPLPRHLLHVQSPVLDLLSDYCQHVWLQSVLNT